ncbi:ABC transporter ATP-binding protein [Clostridium intestinale]|uniref:ABC transporter ATP-binding protein n=1 Tax=Clostridium intestinale URNW TaxID=1294142 RepID=U2NJR5_9CLOT|nr:ABC transporter ATP-binding protein [Clostridium intestinale]ERK29398.1 ABC transporter ATP-binding protein [Clostridium intestinale URNW]
MSYVLEINNLRKTYKGFSLKDINIKLEQGYITGFIGANGAGKSTTIKSVLNLINRDSGDVKIFNKDNKTNDKELKNKIGVVLDEGYFYEELTLKEMKNIISPMYSNWDENQFNNYIRRFNLPLDRKISKLSKGMRMKYSIAIALSHNAELFIMDEPTSGLDPIVREELLEILSDIIQEENKTIFFSTHITSDLDKIADYLIIINDGKILLQGAKDEIIEGHRLVKGDKNLLTLENRKDFVAIKENSYGFEALTKEANKLSRTYGDKLVMEKPNIEEIMLYYIRSDKNANY